MQQGVLAEKTARGPGHRLGSEGGHLVAAVGLEERPAADAALT
jgi:hypothetical protein